MSEAGLATIRLFGTLSSSKHGKKVSKLRFVVPMKLRAIMNQLQSQYDIDLGRDNILILVNGVEANALEDLQTLVQPNDEVVFIPMFHGGLE